MCYTLHAQGTINHRAPNLAKRQDRFFIVWLDMRQHAPNMRSSCSVYLTSHRY